MPDDLPDPRHRRLLALRGDRPSTWARADALVAGLPADRVLRVGPEHTRPAGVARLLGSSFDVVILDLHDGFDPDVLACAQGFVWGGGALILCVPPDLRRVPNRGLAVHPFGPQDVGTRLAARVERALVGVGEGPPCAPVARIVAGTPDQQAVVQALTDAWTRTEPTRTAVLADRGRGKSSALGLALARLPLSARVAVTSASDDGLAEVLRFAGREVTVVDPLELAQGEPGWDVLIVDEAARLPVPLLRRIHHRHPGAHHAWATTTGGYEGTGRGFLLRFLDELERAGPVTRLTLEAPIRWDAGDPVEAWVRDLLVLDGSPADLPVRAPTPALRLARVDRDALAADPGQLAELFGLLVHAHYRTTPGDLARLLDAPNLAIHAAFQGSSVVGVCLVAVEGGLTEPMIADAVAGRGRIRGHALADTLITHGGRAEAGAWSSIRSVRVATHPALRRQGIGRALVEDVHASWQPDLFGTLFGATPELLRFRQELGYALVRVGVSRGSRTGEPAAVMVRPVSDRARALLAGLREDLARDLPVQLALLASDGDLPTDLALSEALAADLGPPRPLDPARRDAAVRAYAWGPRPFDCVVVAVRDLVGSRPEILASLPESDQALIRGRVLETLPWRELAARTGHPTIPGVMRALRRAIRAFVEAAQP